jgi:hypothetical protein
MSSRLTLFYSWQNDAPFSLNRGFIEQAIQEALKRLHLDAALENASRDACLEANEGTHANADAPSVIETFLKKIDECAIFIADLTLVGVPKGALTNVTSSPRHSPNPNVLIEYGYALRTHAREQLIGIANTAYGLPHAASLPFYLRHLCTPITYHLSHPGVSDKKGQLENLVQTLVKAIGAIIPEHSV